MNKWIEIDRKIISNNIKIIKSKIGPRKLMAVVKSNAYGHGIKEVSKIALKSGADMLGVMDVDEALKIEEYGSNVMIFYPIHHTDIPVRKNFIYTVDNLEILKCVSRNIRNKKILINLDVDSGLKRWGIEGKDVLSFVDEIRKMKNVKLFSISTHIAYTPYKNKIEAKEKLERFKEISLKVKKIFADIIIHAANTTVFLDFPQFYFDMVRIGNLIYGIYPKDVYSSKSNNPQKMGISMPWRFFARIISIKEVKKGESFGYASEIVATKNMRIATLPVGYSDGLGMVPTDNVYKISEGERFWAKIGNKKAYFITKPAISHTLIDVTEIPEAKVQSVVELSIRRTAANRDIPRIYK
jgi:alanine racemase